MTTPAEHLADLDLALRAVVDAGALVRRDFGAHGEVTHKSPDQPLTEADLAVDRTLRERLGAARPEYGWLSEETKDDRARLECDRVWIVDPIDGTRSFIAGLPECMICVGLAERGRAAVGVLHNPMTGELYWAVRDAGAYGVRFEPGDCQAGEESAGELVSCDSIDAIVAGQWGRFTLMHDARSAGASAGPVQASGPLPEGAPDASHVRLLVSRSEMDAGEFEPFPENWLRIRRGSTAYKMAGVAAGAGDAFISRGPKSEWDVCAAALVVEEAGGVVTDLRGHDLEYNRPVSHVEGVVVALDGELHARLLELLADMPGVRGAGASEEDE